MPTVIATWFAPAVQWKNTLEVLDYSGDGEFLFMLFPILLEQMQSDLAYPHSVQLPIKVIQTHAAAVFLTGDYAYKLKKTVDFGFLDYSTLAKRKYYLERELELNQPIAPEIYLEVLTINCDDHQLKIKGKGEIVEYVLKMRQFPQDCLLISLFEAGKLEEIHLKELASIVANFHLHSKTNDYISSFGDPINIKKSLDQNYSQTQKYIGKAQTQQQYEQTVSYSEFFFQNKSEVLKNRQSQHKIRECHGDLHLKNICLWHDKIQLFDRIEFNDDFRFVDTMYDIAFTVMDLESRGRSDLSNVFLNTYLELTGDWSGLEVLPLYLCRQAYVRAKVNSFLLDDPEISAQEQENATKTASLYYKLAWQYCQKNTAKLILMSGPSGSGKSTVARYLAKHLNAIHIRSDAVRKHLAQLDLQTRGSENLYSSQMNQMTYQKLIELGNLAIENGFSAILDAKFDRHRWRELAHQVQLIIYCNAPTEVLQKRVELRKHDVSDATKELLESQLSGAEPFTLDEQDILLVLDTTGNWQEELNHFFDSPIS